VEKVRAALIFALVCSVECQDFVTAGAVGDGVDSLLVAVGRSRGGRLQRTERSNCHQETNKSGRWTLPSTSSLELVWPRPLVTPRHRSVTPAARPPSLAA
jgi:hypothetical protein